MSQPVQAQNGEKPHTKRLHTGFRLGVIGALSGFVLALFLNYLFLAIGGVTNPTLNQAITNATTGIFTLAGFAIGYFQGSSED